MAQSGSGDAVSVQEIFNQVVDLGRQLATQTAALTAALARVDELEREGSRRGPSREARSPLEEKGGLYDKTTTLPEKLTRVADFKDWSEDYREYIEGQDEELAELLDGARDSKVAITHMGATEAVRKQAKAVYRSLKRAMVHLDARALVVTVPDKNPFEAWRLLHAKYDPRNDSTAQTMIEAITLTSP